MKTISLPYYLQKILFFSQNTKYNINKWHIVILKGGFLWTTN